MDLVGEFTGKFLFHVFHFVNENLRGKLTTPPSWGQYQWRNFVRSWVFHFASVFLQVKNHLAELPPFFNWVIKTSNPWHSILWATKCLYIFFRPYLYDCFPLLIAPLLTHFNRKKLLYFLCVEKVHIPPTRHCVSCGWDIGGFRSCSTERNVSKQ